MLSNVDVSSSVRSARRYIIHEVLHRGAATVIYRGDLQAAGQFARPVAVKLLKAELVGVTEAEGRLRDEARLLGSIRHRAVIGVHGLVTLQGRVGVVMERVTGADLGTLLRQGPVPVAAALEIVEEVASALDVAWRALGEDGRQLRLCHRAISPRAVRITPEGAVKLLGFDFARADLSTREAATRALSRSFPLAPEVHTDHDGAAADVYALGALLYQLVHGQPLPRSSGGGRALALRHAMDALCLTEPARSGVVSLLYGMLAGSPSERPSAREVQRRASDLRRLCGGTPLTAWAAGVTRRTPATVTLGPADPLVGGVFVEGSAPQAPPAPSSGVPWATLGVLLAGVTALGTGLVLSLVPLLLSAGFGPLRALLPG